MTGIIGRTKTETYRRDGHYPEDCEYSQGEVYAGPEEGCSDNYKEKDPIRLGSYKSSGHVVTDEFKIPESGTSVELT